MKAPKCISNLCNPQFHSIWRYFGGVISGFEMSPSTNPPLAHPTATFAARRSLPLAASDNGTFKMQRLEKLRPLTWNMDVSKNGGTEQPWVFLPKMIILGCEMGVPLFLETPICNPNIPGLCFFLVLAGNLKSPLQNKVFSNRNRGHLGSRFYIYIYIYTLPVGFLKYILIYIYIYVYSIQFKIDTISKMGRSLTPYLETLSHSLTHHFIGIPFQNLPVCLSIP